MDFEIVGEISAVETIAKGLGCAIASVCENCTVVRVGASSKVLHGCGCRVVGYAWLKFTGMKRTALVNENLS